MTAAVHANATQTGKYLVKKAEALAKPVGAAGGSDGLPAQ